MALDLLSSQTPAEEPRAKWRRYVVTGVALVVLLVLGGWYFFRFVSETRVVARFMDAVTAGDFQRGYQIWKPRSTYSYDDFLGDWSTKGYYGPVASYRIVTAHDPPNGGSGVIVVVEVSPVRPFPDAKDVQSAKSRQVSLWVERSDKSLSFPP